MEINVYTVEFPSFWTDLCRKTVQTQIRLLLEEQSDQGLHCLLFHLGLSEALLHSSNFRMFTAKLSSIQIFSSFTVYVYV